MKWLGEVHAIVSPFLFLLPQFMVIFFFFCLFNCAFFLQCSHVMSIQSPYVLNSNVVDNRKIIHKPLS